MTALNWLRCCFKAVLAAIALNVCFAKNKEKDKNKNERQRLETQKWQFVDALHPAL
jgi:hypothetical protein